MRRAAIEVDVAAVGRDADRVNREPQLREQRRRKRRGGAVRAVDHDLRSCERAGGLHDLEQMLNVVSCEMLRRNRVIRRQTLPGAARNAPRRIRNKRLHRRLELLGQLRAGAAEHLDAVVFVRIVRSRDHDAGVETIGASQIRYRGRRHDAGAHDRGALRAQASRELSPRSTLPIRGCRDRSRPACRFLAVRDCRRFRQPASERTSAAPTRATVSGSSGALPALPRIPSVPNNFMVASAKS